MRAVVYDRYGPPEVLRSRTSSGRSPKDDEVLVKVHATTVNQTDCGWRSAQPFIVRYFIGLRRPRRTDPRHGARRRGRGRRARP